MDQTTEDRIIREIEQIVSGEYTTQNSNNKIDRLYCYCNNCVSIWDIAKVLSSIDRQLIE